MENKLDELLHVSRSRLPHRSSAARDNCEKSDWLKDKDNTAFRL